MPIPLVEELHSRLYVFQMQRRFSLSDLGRVLSSIMTEKELNMKYRFTFDDGSEALIHYGVRGMKWGIWNSETRAKYQGGTSKEAKKYLKGYDKYQKAKSKAEAAADRYAANPTAINRYRFQSAGGKEARQNSQVYKDWSRNAYLSYLAPGGPITYGIYNGTSKAQKGLV